jgi:hypothetical protein
MWYITCILCVSKQNKNKTDKQTKLQKEILQMYTWMFCLSERDKNIKTEQKTNVKKLSVKTFAKIK